ncbi:MAG: four helix bundle protein [Bacteroidetes bacterium GWA2_32_17]|nr:MAG: four helix bundle protein [Bacteroidetes bacterium GWA2_32_17]
MNRYKELKVWQEAIDLSVDIYKKTKLFPNEEMYGLTSQLRRAGVSVPSNIAEGAGRNTKGEFKYFLGISNGSACEIDTQLIIANKLDYINISEYENFSNRIEHIKNMIFKLQQTCK